jgi:hypothetical protein
VGVVGDADITLPTTGALAPGEGVSVGGRLTIPGGVKLTSRGALTILGGGQLIVEGTVINQPDGRITNNPAGTITNTGNTIRNLGTIDNRGAILNTGTIINECGGTINNTGTITGNPILDACAPLVELQLNRATFGPGDTLVLSASASSPTPATVDVYVVVQTPDGSFFSLVSTGAIVPGVRPFLANLALPADFSFPSQAVLSIQLPLLGPGRYTWKAAFVAAGTFTPVSDIAEAPFDYDPGVAGQARSLGASRSRP